MTRTKQQRASVGASKSDARPTRPGDKRDKTATRASTLLATSPHPRGVTASAGKRKSRIERKRAIARTYGIIGRRGEWTLEPGRGIAYEGRLLVSVYRESDATGGCPFSPHEADRLARKIVALLNAAKVTKVGKRKL